MAICFIDEETKILENLCKLPMKLMHKPSRFVVKM